MKIAEKTIYVVFAYGRLRGRMSGLKSNGEEGSKLDSNVLALRVHSSAASTNPSAANGCRSITAPVLIIFSTAKAWHSSSVLIWPLSGWLSRASHFPLFELTLFLHFNAEDQFKECLICIKIHILAG